MKILYATDGGEPAVAAADLIERVLDPERTEITVVSVTQTGMPNPASMPYLLDDLEERRTNTLMLVDQTVERLEAAGFAVQGRCLEGNPEREIVRLVEDEWYDITVMGGTAHTWLGNHLLGSVSTYVLHHSPSSVLIVHEAPTDESPYVLVGVDGSRGAGRAVDELCRVAVPGVQVKALSVAAVPLGGRGVPMAPVPVVDTPRRQAEQRSLVDRAWQIAENAAAILRDNGFKAEADATAGHAATELLKEAERGGYELVVVGCRGLSTFRRTLMGSVSDNVARHAPAAFVARRTFD